MQLATKCSCNSDFYAAPAGNLNLQTAGMQKQDKSWRAEEA